MFGGNTGPGPAAGRPVESKDGGSGNEVETSKGSDSSFFSFIAADLL